MGVGLGGKVKALRQHSPWDHWGTQTPYHDKVAIHFDLLINIQHCVQT